MISRTLVTAKCHGESSYTLSKFVDCLVNQFERCDQGVVSSTLVKCKLEDNLLKLSPSTYNKSGSLEKKIVFKWDESSGKFLDSGEHYAMLHHSPICPLGHISREDIKSIPAEIQNRGIDVGVSVLVESKDCRVLITQRSEKMRTFPKAWVPPGGHLEDKETLIDAGLRELKEETGLTLGADTSIEVLCLWESVYPVMLAFGSPIRHHVVVYLLAHVNHTSEELTSFLKIDPEEVSACAWLSLEAVRYLFKPLEIPEPNQKMLVLQPGGELKEMQLDLKTMYNSALWSMWHQHNFSGAQIALSSWLKSIHAISTAKL